MSNSGNDSLNVVLGQIEDELNRVRSARNQVESVLAANDALKEFVGLCGEQSKSSAETLLAEANRLNGLTQAIERAASEGLEAIKLQASDALAGFTASSEEAVDRMSAEAERLTAASEEMGRASTETTQMLRMQASQAQEKLQGVAESTVEKASSALSESAQQAIDRLNDGIDKTKRGLDEAKRDVDAAIELLEESAAGLDRSRDALVEAQGSASDEVKRQSEQTRQLLDATQKQLEEIDTRITTLTSIDFEGLSNELEMLREAEEGDATQLKQQIRNLMIMVGVCIAACVAVLVKSLMM